MQVNIAAKQRKTLFARKSGVCSALSIIIISAVLNPVHAELIAHYELEESGMVWGSGVWGPVNDIAGSNDGVLWGFGEVDGAAVSNSVINQSGPGVRGDNRAYDFATTNSSGTSISGIATPNTLIPATGNFTVLVAFKTSSHAADQGHLFSNNNNQTGRANLMVYNSKLSWWHKDGAFLNSSVSVNDGNWHVGGIAREGNRFDLYLDGDIVASSESSTAISTTYQWLIGRSRNNYDAVDYNGLISDVKVYDAYAIPLKGTIIMVL